MNIQKFKWGFAALYILLAVGIGALLDFLIPDDNNFVTAGILLVCITIIFYIYRRKDHDKASWKAYLDSSVTLFPACIFSQIMGSALLTSICIAALGGFYLSKFIDKCYENHDETKKENE